ncbi:MAG: ABC transporter ATP-binding protein/permease [Lachnospiraceae bacterium]|nr:ABC transporter ATP-binding protein/permease [Lachnospiraceae bacterium]
MRIQHMTNQLTTIKKLLPFLKPCRGLFVLSLMAATVSSLLTLYIPRLTGEAVDCIIGPGNVNFHGALMIIVKIAVCACLAGVFQWIMSILNNKMTFEIVRDMRNAAFKNIERLPLKYLDSNPSGDLMSRVIADADQFADGLLMGFTQFFTGVVTILGTLFFMLLIDWRIGLLVVVLTPLSFFVAKFIATHTYEYAKLQAGIRGEETGFVNEMIAGQKVVKAFGREEAVLRDFDEINERMEKASLKATFYSSLTNPSTRFVNNTVYALVAIAGAFAAIGKLMTVGELTSFLSYASQYTRPFNEISGVITELQGAIACAERLVDLIEEEPEIPDPADAEELNMPEGRVRMDSVYFSYTPDRELIRDFSLSVDPGMRIAIVGPTGCGKTTLINLLMRFYDVNSGSISVDGRDIRKVTRKSLRDSYGMVLQDTWLRSGTIRDNLTIGNPEATDEEIIEAAKTCHSHSFIRRLPKGYDTYIGEDGGGLSAGQKQLLCITRVMLSSPDMLILDEATSSIDTRTEIRIQKAFHNMMAGRTSFIVAHRLSTIRESDLILCMRDGNIVESGTHKELLEEKGFYYQLYMSQFSGKAI